MNRRRRLSPFVGWRSVAAVAVALSILAGIDVALKTSAPGSGYCPSSTTWLVAAEDLGRFVALLDQTESAGLFLEEVPDPTQALGLHLRKTTGIRPTPARWRFWMGHRFLAAGSDEGTGICVYPGLIMRAADMFNRHVLRTPADDGIRVFRGYFYAWRDRFLIVSPSPEYVRAALTDPPPQLEPLGGADELQLYRRRNRETFLRIRAANALPVEGRLRAAITSRDKPLTLADAWPETPVASVAASGWQDVRTLLEVAAGMLPEDVFPPSVRAAAIEMRNRWGLGRFPEGWATGIEECALGICAVDTDYALPVPECALILRSPRALPTPHPLAPLLAADESVPYEWHGEDGLLMPVLGAQFSLCLGRHGRDWLFTTSEPLMANLADGLHHAETINADAALSVDWGKVGLIAEDLLATAGELELIPGKNAEEVNRDFIPWARGFSRLGQLRLDGTAEDGWLVFNGHLCQPAPAEPVRVGEGESHAGEGTDG